jgi:parallel beta-helix repeat protein
VINKSITLLGSGPDNTIISGYNSVNVLRIAADNCNVSGFTVTGINCYFVITLAANNSLLENCISTGNVVGLFIHEADNNVVRNITCESNTGAGVYLAGADYNEIKNIQCFNSTYGMGYYLWYSTRNHFQDGLCKGNDRDGFYAYWLSDFNTITNYTFIDNKGTGIQIFESDNFVIDNCLSSDNGLNGIIISSIGNQVSNFTSRNNAGDGFYIDHSIGSKFIDCISYSNKGRGFYIRYSEDNIFSRNLLVSNSDLGIRVDSNSLNNKLYLNDIINNSFEENQCQVVDLGEDNQWFSGTTGNFWWDYCLQNSNSSQDDQVWDVPYIISWCNNVKDEFPLAEPVTDPEDLEQIQPGLMEDTDADGVFNMIDAFPQNSKEWQDSDCDGVGNNEDTDDDNDHLPDDAELKAGTRPLDSDTDNDSHLDGADEFPLDPKKWTTKVPEETDEDDEIGLPFWVRVLILLIITGIILVFISILQKDRPHKKKEK